MGERRGVYRVFVGKPVGKRQLGGPRPGWGNNNKMDFKYVECEVTDGSSWLRIWTGG
jgi:hypothetical protein